MTEFHLSILSPNRSWFEGSAESVTAPGQDGEFGVLAHHIPLLAGLKAGVVTVRAPGGKILYFAVDGGVLGFDRQSARLLTGRAIPCDTPEAAHAACIELKREV